MKKLKYDVAIIGAGLGGLTIASLLVKAGYHVLVMDKLPFVGGRCSTLDYQGFKLPTGVVWASDEVHGALCREVGAEFEIRVPKPQYYFRTGGRDYEAPYTGIFRAMIRQVSGEGGEGGKVMAAFKRALSWAEPSRSMSLQDWAQQYTSSAEILSVFQTFVAMDTGLNAFELPAGEFFRFIKETSFVKNMGFLPYGGGYVSQSLEKAIKKGGGEVWTRCRAQHILIKDGAATGLIARHGEESLEIQAQAVVCNAGPRQLVALSGESVFDPGYRRDLSAIKSAPQIIIFMAGDKPLLPEGRAMFCLPEARRAFALIQYTDLCPEMAPRGKCLLAVVVFLTDSQPPYDLKKEVELALQDVRENIPQFDKYGRVLRINCYHGDWALMRTWGGYSLPIQTSVEGLYLAGDSSAPSGWWGSSAAIKSGRLVTEDIRRRFKAA